MQSFSRNGHEFSFLENGAVHRNPDGREHALSFSEKIKVRFHPWSRRLLIGAPKATLPLHQLAEADQRAFLLEFFRRWNSRDPEAAKKGAFDYAEDAKNLSRLALVVCLLFTLPMTVALINESWDQHRCTKALAAGTAEGVMTVTKVKKVKKQDYILTMEFATPDGRRIKGYDRAQVLNEDELPKTMPILFSPEKPECWAQAFDLGKPGISWAKRRYFAAVSFLLGLFFLGLTAFGMQWSIGKLRRPPPYREEVRALFQL